jgi:hypothetical protein
MLGELNSLKGINLLSSCHMVEWLLAHQHGAHTPRAPSDQLYSLYVFKTLNSDEWFIIYVSHATGSDAAARELCVGASVTELTWGHTARNRPPHNSFPRQLTEQVNAEAKILKLTGSNLDWVTSHSD